MTLKIRQNITLGSKKIKKTVLFNLTEEFSPGLGSNPGLQLLCIGPHPPIHPVEYWIKVELLSYLVPLSFRTGIVSSVRMEDNTYLLVLLYFYVDDPKRKVVTQNLVFSFYVKFKSKIMRGTRFEPGFPALLTGPFPPAPPSRISGPSQNFHLICFSGPTVVSSVYTYNYVGTSLNYIFNKNIGASCY